MTGHAVSEADKRSATLSSMFETTKVSSNETNDKQGRKFLLRLNQNLEKEEQENTCAEESLAPKVAERRAKDIGYAVRREMQCENPSTPFHEPFIYLHYD